MSITLYGIPSCGTVKKARKWLDERGLAHTFVDFRDTPPSGSQVDAWVAALTAKKMRNTSGGAYRALPDDKKGWDDATWAEHFKGDPMLIKRPIVEKDGAAVRVGWRGSDEEIAASLGL